MNIKDQPLGAHLSISKGFDHAIKEAEELNCTAMQIFLHSNRQWAMKDLSKEKIKSFKDAAINSPVQSIIVHASYLLNLGTPDNDLLTKSTDILMKELEQCNQLGIPYLVLHPGTYTNSTIEQSLKRVSESLDRVFDQVPGTAKILLENTAGQGSQIGSKLEELAKIRTRAKHKNRIGFCLDTCHAFAAGYDFTTPDKYKEFWAIFDDVLGIENLKVFHFNDSKKGLGAKVDRHEDIGKGQMGLAPFKLILNDEKLFAKPKVLETPYDKNYMAQYKNNLTVLRNLIK